ncbi:MAG: hypothetical protein V3T59_07980 [Desulfobacterales bacterium]
MANKNCWEAKECGREVGGPKTVELGVCPASKEIKLNGANNGKNAGRACWVMDGTLCAGKIQGTFADKMRACMDCEFYMAVQKEERDDFINTPKLKAMLG